MSSVFDRLLSASAAVCGDLALVLSGQAVTVRVQKLPVVRIELDPLPLLLVAASPRPESSDPFATGGLQSVWYSLQLVLVASSNRTVTTGLPDILEARESLRKAFQRPTPLQAKGLAELLMTQVVPDAPLARGKWFQNHDASGITARLRCIESAS